MNKAFLILSILFCSCYNCEKANIASKKEFLFCKIESIYRDPRNRNAPTIEIKNIKGNFYKGLAGDELIGIFEFGERGDTVIKEVNSLQYKLIKKDTIMYFYPICECKEIK